MTTLINGIPSDTVPVSDRGFQYGDGLFETIAIQRGTPLLWDGHMRRLADGCARLGLCMPAPDILLDEITAVCKGTERAVGKIIITRGPAGRGYAATKGMEQTRVVSHADWPVYPAGNAREGVAVHLCATRLGRNPALAGIKHLNRLEQVLARAEWSVDCADGLMCDSDGFVIEGTMTNVFAVLGGTLITPELSQSGVAGVMRAEVLSYARECGMGYSEEWIAPDRLRSADEIFLTNSIIGIWPVRILASRSYGIGETTHTIQKALEASQCYTTGI
jgi:4-amino-4-deoxychorismate lyase